MSRGTSSSFGAGPRLLSQPVGVEWAGWRSDTLELQRAGWKLAVEYDAYRHSYRLLMTHDGMELWALSRAEVLEDSWGDQYQCRDLSRYPVFRVQSMARCLQVIQMHDNFANFRQIDAEPQFTEQKIQRAADMNIFAPYQSKAEEVLIDKADMTVIEHLEAIKALQSEKQREIRDRIMREPQSSGKTIVAQLISYREAA